MRAQQDLFILCLQTVFIIGGGGGGSVGDGGDRSADAQLHVFVPAVNIPVVVDVGQAVGGEAQLVRAIRVVAGEVTVEHSGLGAPGLQAGQRRNGQPAHPDLR
jgi:hypothetical protein